MIVMLSKGGGLAVLRSYEKIKLERIKVNLGRKEELYGPEGRKNMKRILEELL
jgi:hypothetical protein